MYPIVNNDIHTRTNKVWGWRAGLEMVVSRNGRWPNRCVMFLGKTLYIHKVPLLESRV